MVSSTKRSRLVHAALAVACCVGVAEVVVPSAAYASTPQCTTTTTVPGIDEAGDATRVIVPASSGGNATCWMQRGNNSAAVAALQKALNMCNRQAIAFGPYYNIYPLAVDGDYGGHTYDAVWNLQVTHGISRDGVYGSQTRDHMEFLVQPGASDATCGSKV